MKILPVGAQLCPCGRTDRRADMTKLIVAFHDFANAPKYGAGMEHFTCTVSSPLCQCLL